jgi:hypothetical protein
MRSIASRAKSLSVTIPTSAPSSSTMGRQPSFSWSRTRQAVAIGVLGLPVITLFRMIVRATVVPSTLASSGVPSGFLPSIACSKSLRVISPTSLGPVKDPERTTSR